MTWMEKTLPWTVAYVLLLIVLVVLGGSLEVLKLRHGSWQPIPVSDGGPLGGGGTLQMRSLPLGGGSSHGNVPVDRQAGRQAEVTPLLLHSPHTLE